MKTFLKISICFSKGKCFRIEPESINDSVRPPNAIIPLYCTKAISVWFYAHSQTGNIFLLVIWARHLYERSFESYFIPFQSIMHAIWNILHMIYCFSTILLSPLWGTYRSDVRLYDKVCISYLTCYLWLYAIWNFSLC